MKIAMSQAELCNAVALYLSEKVLRKPVAVKSVKPEKVDNIKVPYDYILHVNVTTKDFENKENTK